MYTVAQLSQESGISPHTIRYYIRSGLLPPRKTRQNSYRLFCTQDVQRVKFIYQAKRLGLDQEAIQQVLHKNGNLQDSATAASDQVYTLLKERIKTMDVEIKKIQQLQQQAQQALEQCQGIAGQSSHQAKIQCLMLAIANIEQPTT